MSMDIRMEAIIGDNLHSTPESISKAMGDLDKSNKSKDIQKESLNSLHLATTSLECSKPDNSLKSKHEILEKIHETQSFEKVTSLMNVESQENNQVKSHSEEKVEQLDPEKHSTIYTIQETKCISETTTPHNRVKSNSNITQENKNKLSSAVSDLNQIDKVTKNQSDIFSPHDEVTVVSSIFSVNGSPSRKLYRKKDLPPNNVFPESHNTKDEQYSSVETVVTKEKTKERLSNSSYNDLKRPSSSIRNPLTGTGLSSNDEYKCKATTRKDGNPLLGLGYNPEVIPSTHRIPPGGYSHKLW